MFEDLKNVDEMILFRSKNVDGSFFPDEEFSYTHTPEIEQYYGDFKSMMWFEIVTKLEKPVGQLVKPDLIDVTEKIIGICLTNKVKFTLTNFGVRVWGYVEHGYSQEFYT
ncbi:Putative uncharacterized protein VP1792 [Moritella viscosa]|nr:Putative uncharacterized protein VP1792 [Moritella viscosa]SHO23173.1 Putative uncharacterized protein VP1792 [Moritella viscosa]